MFTRVAMDLSARACSVRFRPIADISRHQYQRRMRWIAALLALCLFGAVAVYFLAVRDRTFRSYAGVELGMPLGTALSRLRANRYIIVQPSPEARNRRCSDGDIYSFVYGPDPTHSLTVSLDANCKVSRLARRLRGSDL